MASKTQHYEFTKTLVVDGHKYAAGHVVTEDDLPEGNRLSMLGVGWLRKCDPPAAEESGEPKAAAEKKPAKQKAAG